MNLPPPPNLTITMAQEFEIAKHLKSCEGASKEELLAVIESCLHQMTMYRNTIADLVKQWPNE